ncbi:MAG: hypothetical protein JW755_07550 [Candidatus Aminicenantes bacterium]|nr:hypothetical protein [Candidatus Aminicenantes bacterium]
MLKTSNLIRLGVGLIIIAISLYGSLLLKDRPGFSPEAKEFLSSGNLIKINENEIRNLSEIEFILITAGVNEDIEFHVRTPRGIETESFDIVRFYAHTPYPLIFLFVGILCMAVGLFVFIFRPNEIRIRLFYWSSLTFSSALILHGGYYVLHGDWMNYIPGMFFYIAYSAAPALLLHFSLTFYSDEHKKSMFLVYIPSVVFILILESFYLWANLASSIKAYRLYNSAFFYFRLYILAYIIFTFTNFILAYRKTESEHKRAQIKWVLYGLIMGLVPFVLFFQIWKIFDISPLFSEEVVTVFFLFVPLGFVFAIIKFRLLDIEFVINRSLVYSILTVIIVSIYLLIVQVFQKYLLEVFRVQELVIYALGALVAAVVFHPARKRIQELVNRLFFRLSYDYNKCIKSFIEKARLIIERNDLVELFIKKVQSVLPVTLLQVYVSASQSDQVLTIYKGGEEEKIQKLVSIFKNETKFLARKKAVRIDEEKWLDFGWEIQLEQNKLDMVIPLSFDSESLKGFIFLGRKKSGERYSREDLDFLATMRNELAGNIERIDLQEKVVYERAENEKLNELNIMKTNFLSSVSHEIRTPMSSIQGLSEMLYSGKINDRAKQEEILDIMVKESTRLSRLLHNIMDFGKIEQGIKTFDFKQVDIRAIIADVITLFRSNLESKGFTLSVEIPKAPLYLVIDKDAVKQVLINIMDNAIKYSPDKKDIRIRVIETEKVVEVHIRDRGIGIPEPDHRKIFDGFFRGKNAIQEEPKGVGLGLKIARNIMESHKGVIRVESYPDMGSTFVLIFPKQ